MTSFSSLTMSVLRFLHAWAGAVLALLFVVIGLSGSALVLKDDWLRLTLPEARVEVEPAPSNLGRAVEAIERSRPGAMQRVVLAGPDLGIQQVYLTDESYAYADITGRVIAQWRGRARLETWIYELHHFLLAGERGMRLVGAAGLAALLFALSGLVLSLPTWRSFSLRLWPRSARLRDVLGAHRNLGMVAALPIVTFALTGAGLIFYQTTQGWLTRTMPGLEEETFFPPSSAGIVDWPRALVGAQQQFPTATLRMVVWPQDDGWPAVVRLRQRGEWDPNGNTKVYIDPSTSLVIATSDPRTLGRGLRLYRLLYPLHAAAVGGRVYDLVAFAAGLALSGLGALGLWSFIQRHFRTGAGSQRTGRAKV